MSFVSRLILAAAFAALMALGARLEVPMQPVPMTMQSWAVILAGAALGPRWGVAAVGLYLAAATLGLPVLADGASGPAPFTGPTAGYIVAFPLAAFVAGVWGSDAGRPVRVLTIALGAHVLILALGAAWLSRSIGWPAALDGGVWPFLPGMAVKSGLVLAALWALRRLGVRRA